MQQWLSCLFKSINYVLRGFTERRKGPTPLSNHCLKKIVNHLTWKFSFKSILEHIMIGLVHDLRNGFKKTICFLDFVKSCFVLMQIVWCVEGNNNIYGVYCLLYDTVPTPHRITDCILCLIVTTLHDLTFSFRKWILKDVLSDFKTYSKSVSIDIIWQIIS